MYLLFPCIFQGGQDFQETIYEGILVFSMPSRGYLEVCYLFVSIT